MTEMAEEKKKSFNRTRRRKAKIRDTTNKRKATREKSRLRGTLG